MSDTSKRIAYGLLAVEIVAIVVLAYMRFVLGQLPLISGINSGPGSLLAPLEGHS